MSVAGGTMDGALWDAVSSLPDVAAGIVDRGGRIRRVSPGWEALLGASAEAFTDRPVDEVLPELSAVLGRQGLAHRPSAHEVELASATGPRRFRVRVFPRWGGRGTYQGAVLLLRLPLGEAERDLWDQLCVGLCEWRPADGRLVFTNRALAEWLDGLRPETVGELVARLGRGPAVAWTELLPPGELALRGRDGGWLAMRSVAHAWRGHVITLVRREARGNAPICPCRLLERARARLASQAAGRGVSLALPLARFGCAGRRARPWANPVLIEELVVRLLRDAVDGSGRGGSVGADFAWTEGGCSLWVTPARADQAGLAFCRWAAAEAGGSLRVDGSRALIQLPCGAAAACMESDPDDGPSGLDGGA